MRIMKKILSSKEKIGKQQPSTIDNTYEGDPSSSRRFIFILTTTLDQSYHYEYIRLYVTCYIFSTDDIWEVIF